MDLINTNDTLFYYTLVHALVHTESICLFINNNNNNKHNIVYCIKPVLKYEKRTVLKLIKTILLLQVWRADHRTNLNTKNNRSVTILMNLVRMRIQ